MKTTTILLFFLGIAFCYWDPLMNLHHNPEFHVEKHHKGKTPCHIPEKFVTHISKSYLDKDGCPTSYHLGIFMYDFPGQKVRFDEVSYYNATKNTTHWLDFGAGKAFSYNHVSKKCVSKDISGKTLKKMELMDGKFMETLLVGSEAIDLWKVQKSHSHDKIHAIVGVTEGTCFLTNLFAFKMSSTSQKGLIPIAAASMWNFAPTVPLYQFHLPEVCQKAEPSTAQIPIEDMIEF